MSRQRDLTGREEQVKNPQKFAPFKPRLVPSSELLRRWQEREGWHTTTRLLNALEKSLGTREFVISHSQKEI